MKRVIVLLALAAFSLNVQAANSWHKTIESAQKEAKRRNTLIFVDLFAEWCGWCHKAEAEVFPSEDFQKATDDMVLLRLDTEDRAEGTNFAQTLGITSLPTFVLITPDLMLAGSIKGYAPAKPFSLEVVKRRQAYAAFEKELATNYGSNWDKHLEMADRLVAYRGFSKAETRLRTLLAAPKAPASVKSRAQFSLAEAQRGMKKYDDARKSIAALQKMPHDAKLGERAAFFRAQLHMDQMKWGEALAELKKFKTKYPTSAQMPQINFLIPQLESAVQRAQ